MLAAEALLAVTGLFHDQPLGPKDGRLAAALPRDWKAAVDDFLDARKPRRFKAPPHVDWEKTWTTLSAGIDEQQVTTVTAALQDDAVDQDYKLTLSNAWEYVRSRWPVLQLDTITGPRLLSPGRVELGKAETLLATIDDPCRVLDEMRSQTLTYDQAEALQAVYPALYDMLKAILSEALDLRAGRSKAYTVPHGQEMVIRKVWGAKPGVTLSRIEPPAAKNGTPSVKIDFKHLRTKAQGLEDISRE
jgi:hypothetical protein